MAAVATTWPHYEYQPSFVLGFHGCEKTVGEKLIRGTFRHLDHSRSDYDWLGHGIYFWEGNPERAMRWAQARQKEGRIRNPFVLGAIIDLRRCLDLFDSAALSLVAEAHQSLSRTIHAANAVMPQNTGSTSDRKARKLDCATINYLHQYLEDQNIEPL